MKVGDQIADVNGVNFDDVTHAKAIEVLTSQDHIIITLRVGSLSLKFVLFKLFSTLKLYALRLLENIFLINRTSGVIQRLKKSMGNIPGPRETLDLEVRSHTLSWH